MSSVRLHGWARNKRNAITELIGVRLIALVDPFTALPFREFFAVFARSEYAMKEAGYKRDDHGIAAPAWQRLANDASTWLDVQLGSDVAQAIAPLTNDPPKLLSFANGWQS